jgi:hypothetical protein
MHMVNSHALTDLLFETEQQMDELGWGQPSVLFALHGPIEHPQLEYAVQLPGGAGDLLHAMITSGMSVRGNILGLVLVANSPYPLDVDDWLAMPVRCSSFSGPREGYETRLLAPRNGAGTTDGPASVSPARAVIAALRDSSLHVVARRQGDEPREVPRIPERVADHAEIACLLLRLLHGKRLGQHITNEEVLTA